MHLFTKFAFYMLQCYLQLGSEIGLQVLQVILKID